MIIPHVAVLIVAYQHAATLPATLEALARQTVPPTQVVVVDNGDGSSAAVARVALPSVIVLEPSENLGFASGCNFAAQHTTAPIIALVNPDVVLDPTWIATITVALADPQVGIVGSKLMFADGTLQHAGGVLHWPLPLSDHRGYGERDQGQWDTTGAVDYATGAALALRREVWDTVNGLDPAFYPAYWEEVDLCLRVATLGKTIQYLPTARGTHIEASALGRTSPTYYRLYHLNRLRLLWKHRPNPWLITDWLPAEFAHLRTTANDAEIDALLWAYSAWQAVFAGSGDWRTRVDGWDEEALERRTQSAERRMGELAWALRELGQKRELRPLPFRSRWPWVAALRTLWNKLATETYLRPIIQQQNDYNAALHDLAIALERQRRTSDGAVLAQGMLLAKINSERHEA